MITQVGVCNDCLVRLGDEPITAIDESTNRAVILKAVWDLTRDAELRRHRWRFAQKKAGPLAPLSTTPEAEWDYEFQIPNDSLMVHGIATDIDDDENQGIKFAVDGDKVRCNESSIYLFYTTKQDDPSKWDPCFAEALGIRLSMKVGYKLTQSNSLVDRVTKEYQAFMQDARTLSAMEATTKPLVFTGGWLDARR